jgi:cytidylate kinase
MYRAFAWRMLKEGLSASDTEAVEALAGRVRIDVRFEDGRQRTYAAGTDVTELSRTPESSMGASDCGTVGAGRRLMVALQPQMPDGSPTCGRPGHGTRVLRRDVSVFGPLPPEVRARRRYEETIEKAAGGIRSVLADVIVRDRRTPPGRSIPQPAEDA